MGFGILGWLVGWGLLPGLAGLLIAAIPVRVTRTSGDAIEGELAGLEAAAIRVDRGGEPVRISVDEIVSLVPQRSGEAADPPMRVLLRDGSRVAARSVTLSDDALEATLSAGGPLTVPVRRVAAIRFRRGTPATDPRWLGMLEQPPRGDRLAIRRDGGRLDAVGGVVKSIDAERVRFSLGDDTVDAPLGRLEGVVFGSSGDEPAAAAIATVEDRHGSRWVIESWTPGEVEESIEVRLAGSLRHAIPVDSIASIRFSSGLRRLADQEPAGRDFRPYLETDVPAELLEGWFGPRVGEDGELEMFGGSSVSYRVEPGFAKLLGSVRRDPEADRAGKLVVRVALDDRVVWEQELTDRSPQGFEIELRDAARVRFEVSGGGDGEVGDVARFLRSRFVK